jgi:hypothetical protein
MESSGRATRARAKAAWRAASASRLIAQAGEYSTPGAD